VPLSTKIESKITEKDDAYEKPQFRSAVFGMLSMVCLDRDSNRVGASIKETIQRRPKSSSVQEQMTADRSAASTRRMGRYD